MKKISIKNMYFFLVGFLILFSVVVGIITRMSYVDDTNVEKHVIEGDSRYLNIINDEVYANHYFNNDIENIEDLTNLADSIVLVSTTSDRTNYNQSILTKVKVLDVLKGNMARKTEYLYVYEPNNFKYNTTYYSLYGYNIMQIDKNYLLFLERLKVPDDYKYKKMKILLINQYQLFIASIL